MATNKLRKRLEEADDQTLSKMTENFCMIGTPLPRLDGKRDENEYKPVWQQEVLDEQGRRRFHGAFTGGYSAGYYNTVGSKEGWAPSTFRSSRKDKLKGASAAGTSGTMGSRPEDFMDEEDLEALREGRGALNSTHTYEMQQESQRERDPLMDMLGLDQKTSGSQSSSALDHSSLVSAASSSLGTKLLQRMGWRQGQGLGPRISFKRRKELLTQLGKPITEESMDDEEAEKHLWPPPDTPMPAFSTKNDAKGLGWTGESREVGLNEALRRARGEVERMPSRDKKPGGFGLGALEEDSDGEDDVYAAGSRIEESTLARKFDNEWSKKDRERLVIGGAPRGTSNVSKKEVPTSKNASSNDNVWHDGKAMIVGFRIASRTDEKEPWFDTPLVPRDWKPEPQTVWSNGAKEVGKSNDAHNMSAVDRATILGEARLPGPPPSIQDYLSLKDKERLQRGKEAAASLREQRSAAPLPKDLVEEPTEIPTLDAAIAKAALKGYMPFNSEPEKQKRYHAYLDSQANPSKESLAALQPSKTQSKAQFTAELRDFAKSASIFKPMSTVMASRFESSVGGSNDLPQINPGLHIPEPKANLSAEEEKAKEEEEKKAEEDRKRKEEMGSMTSLQRNARLGLFGRDTTREVMIWKPARLLCKRFNVPMPYPDQEEDTVKEDTAYEKDQDDAMEAAFGASKVRKREMPKVNAKWEASKKQLQQLAAQRNWEGESTNVGRTENSEVEVQEPEREVPKPGQGKAALDVNNIGLGEVEEKEEDIAFVKPPMDVFKAVFADDDDDDDDEEEEEEKEGNLDKNMIEEKHDFPTVKPKVEEEAIISSDEVQLSSIDNFKPTFVPRKRRADEGETKKQQGMEKRKKKDKSKSKGLLTFSVDDEGQEEEAPKSKPSSGRLRAADLFN